MSGHSKWAQIKRQKGVADQKRGQAFTKMANAITIAVRQGGGVGDPNQNFRLRLEVEKARSINMPKENIQRAIDRGMGKGEKDIELAEVVYEGFGPSGTAIIVEAVTDNKNRTTPEVKSLLDKNGGSLATPGAVSYQFQQMGQITVAKNGNSIDDIFIAAVDGGAIDIEEAGEEVFIYADVVNLSAVKEAVQKEFVITSSEVIRKPTISVSITDKGQAKKILDLMEKIESHDDVQKVYANFDIADELLTE